MNIFTIIIAIIVFGILIFVHELGHFLTAKWAGIRVNEFAMGMGPLLFSRTRGETAYTLRMFPIGGACVMEGEDEENSSDRAFNRAPILKRIVVIIAGSAMNILLGLLLVGILSAQMPVFGSTIVADFQENAISSAHLQIGDKIIKMDGHRVRTINDIDYEFSRSRDGIMDIEVLRNGEERILLPNVQFDMRQVEGINFINMDFRVSRVEKTPLGVVSNTFNWTISLVKQVWGSLMDLITGRYTVNQMSGPVGVTTAISQASSMGWQSLVLLVSIITLNLGVFNLLPVPALDGGRLLFLLIELVRRKPIEPRYEGTVHFVGFVLLIGLMIFTTVNDILKLI